MSGWLDSLEPDLRELVLGFEGECADHVRALGDALLEIADADEKRLPELVAVAFRAAHSVKGGAASLQLDGVTKLAHAMETLLSAARKSGRRLGEGERWLLLEGGDLLLASLRAAIAGTEPPDARKVIAALAGEAPQANPGAAPAAEVDDRGRTLRVDVGRLDALGARTAELLVARLQALDRAKQASELADAVEDLHRQLPRVSRGALASAVFVERAAERLRSALMGDADGFGQLAEDMLAAIQGIRLTPLNALFGTLRRTALDAARRCGKEIALELSGEQVEFDKQVLDALKDPLVALLRNAVDHGLEDPAARAAAGKPRAGRVAVRARQVGDRAFVEVWDDGAGVDVDALRRKAVALGLKTQGEVDALSAEQALELMTLPGLSTRESAGELSGRGVGLDLARRNVEGLLHGAFSMRSRRGEGTTFSIAVPISIATVTGLVVELESQKLAVLASGVEQVVRMKDFELRPIEGRPSIQLPDGSFVEVVDLGAQLGRSPPRPRQAAMILAQGERRCAFAVDGIEGEQAFVFKPILPPLRATGMVVGGAVLAGDYPLVVLGGSELLAGRVGANAVAPRPAPSERTLDVLVVDDSFTTRSLEVNILKKHGCHVRTAVNGQDALAELGKARPDVLVTDIEMPVMDGLTLCRAVRADAALSTVPIVLVTSLAGAEQRAAGLDAGADAYIEKGAFDQVSFLETLRRLAGK